MFASITRTDDAERWRWAVQGPDGEIERGVADTLEQAQAAVERAKITVGWQPVPSRGTS